MLIAVSDGAMVFTSTVGDPSCSAVPARLLIHLQVFIGALVAPVLLFMLPPFGPRPGVPYRKRLSELDYLERSSWLVPVLLA